MIDVEGEAAVLGGLLGKVAAGDMAAFADFYDRTRARTYGMIVRVLRDPGYSEETLQEVYLQVWSSAKAFDAGQGSPLSWLITLAHRRAVDRVRSEQSATERESRYGARTASIDYDVVSDAALRSESGRQVNDCLGSLTDLQWQALELAYYRGFTYREVSEQVSAGLPTVKSRIRDGLRRLKSCLGVNPE